MLPHHTIIMGFSNIILNITGIYYAYLFILLILAIHLYYFKKQFNPILASLNGNIDTSKPFYTITRSFETTTKEIITGSTFDSFFYNSPIGFYRITQHGKIIIANQAFSTILGYKNVDDIKNENLFEIYLQHNSDRAEFFRTLKMTGKVTNFEDCIRNNEGYIIYTKESVKAIHDNDGNLLYFEGYIEDITDKKKTLRALRITEEKYKNLINHIPVGIYRITLGGEVLFANQHLADILGYDSAEQLKGLSAFDYLFNVKETKEYIKKIIASKKESFSIEYKLKNQKGETIWVQDTSKIVLDTSGDVLFLDGIIEDITLRKDAEQELLRLSIAINQTSESIVITDELGYIEYCNPAFEKLTQYSFDELKGKNMSLLKSGKQDNIFYDEFWQTINSGKIWTGNLINKRKNNELYEEYNEISPVKNPDGSLFNFIAVKRDVTEERKLEQQLRQNQKLQAIGTLAGGIAHDFNNILMGMQIYTELLLKKFGTETQEHSITQKIYDSQNRAKDLIRQILSFSRQSGDERQPILVHAVIKEALRMIQSTFPSTIKFELDIKDCGNILANPTQIHQIIMNLCTNANQAMEGHGTLKVEFCNYELSEDEELQPKNTSIKKWVRLTVQDTGCGIDKKVNDRIFEPFFTTKAVGQGTGLGLATVHGIVKQYDGEIFFSSQTGVGTVFYIYLPA
jgi:PAS domain S-box-containing protein